jgi:quercetin dioxygenase-like cupin family protein
MKRSVAVCAVLGGLFAAAPAAVDLRLVPPHVMVTPSELHWTESEALPPGAKVAIIQGSLDAPGPFIIRIKYPPDYTTPAHRHDAIEHVTVISGTIHMGSGDEVDTSKTKALPPGSVAIMMPGMPHFTLFKEEAIVQVHGNGPWGIHYLNPRDDPRRKKK